MRALLRDLIPTTRLGRRSAVAAIILAVLLLAGAVVRVSLLYT